MVSDWAKGKLKIALDLHCPRIRGKYNQWIYLVGGADPDMEKKQLQFSSILEKNCRGELKFRSKDFLPFNMVWNTGSHNSKGTTFAQWTGSMEGIQLATTIEFPYANITGTQLSIKNA